MCRKFVLGLSVEIVRLIIVMFSEYVLVFLLKWMKFLCVSVFRMLKYEFGLIFIWWVIVLMFLGI